jgi:hypothetical protein
MKTLGVLLRDRQGMIAQRWLEVGLTTYPSDSASAFKRQKDPFANPVGHSLRLGTKGIVAALLDGGEHEKIQQHLNEIIKIRAVQQITPSEAIRFVFALKQAVREELGPTASDPQILPELEAFDREIDRVALAAFDSYVECRERVSELRIGEIKRQVSWVMDRVNRRSSDSQMTPVDST